MKGIDMFRVSTIVILSWMIAILDSFYPLPNQAPLALTGLVTLIFIIKTLTFNEEKIKKNLTATVELSWKLKPIDVSGVVIRLSYYILYVLSGLTTGLLLYLLTTNHPFGLYDVAKALTLIAILAPILVIICYKVLKRE